MDYQRCYLSGGSAYFAGFSRRPVSCRVLWRGFVLFAVDGFPCVAVAVGLGFSVWGWLGGGVAVFMCSVPSQAAGTVFSILAAFYPAAFLLREYGGGCFLGM